jgi:N-carbamoyl-L-amino-acid hydrolase
VLAGLGVIAELSKAGLVPPRDLTLALFRAEEAAWFPLSYPGSRAALGRLAPAELRSARSDTGRSLADHLVDAGFDPDPIRRGIPQIHPEDIAAFIEVHIEQGPRLLTLGCPMGIVTSIAGGFRFTEAHCRGQYAHSGAEPRFSRRDAVLGFADLMVALEAEWDTIETSGREATITVGRVQSDPAEHGGSKVLGDVGFTLDLRSADESLLADLRLRIIAICRDIEARRGVRFDLGPSFSWSAAEMSAALRGRLSELAAEMGLEVPPVPSGAGHDAVTFAEAGIPTAMVFLRNRNGSHNPDEDMDVADLDAAMRLLTRVVMSFDE